MAPLGSTKLSAPTVVAAALLASMTLLAPTFLYPTAQQVIDMPGQHQVPLPEQTVGGVEDLGFGEKTVAGSSGVARIAGVGLALAGVAALAVARRCGASQTKASKNTVVMHAFENELGVQGPVGFWDPVGFTADGDVAAFKRRRSVELKHSRICMLACMGYMTPEIAGKFPGYLSPSQDLKFEDVPNGLGALSKVPALGWAQIIAYFGFCEISGGFEDYKKGTPGDYGWKVLTSADPAEKNRKLQSELANGRLAMFAIMSMLFQNGICGSTGPEMWYGLKAAASDAPPSIPKWLQGTGGPSRDDFWDPAGLAKGKSEEQLLHWRAVELKHGRVCMCAVLGWFHTAAGWHPIGDFANGVRVSDDPLIAVAQMPMGGIWQIVFTIMCFEWMWTYPCPPPKEAPWDIFGWTDLIVDPEDPEWRDNGLKELNNGRLAMVGMMGLLVQDATTGDYFPGIAQKCFGNVACQGTDTWSPVPKVPFVMPPLYPGQMNSIFPPEGLLN